MTKIGTTAGKVIVRTDGERKEYEPDEAREIARQLEWAAEQAERTPLLQR